MENPATTPEPVHTTAPAAGTADSGNELERNEKHSFHETCARHSLRCVNILTILFTIFEQEDGCADRDGHDTPYILSVRLPEEFPKSFLSNDNEDDEDDEDDDDNPICKPNLLDKDKVEDCIKVAKIVRRMLKIPELNSIVSVKAELPFSSTCDEDEEKDIYVSWYNILDFHWSTPLDECNSNSISFETMHTWNNVPSCCSGWTIYVSKRNFEIEEDVGYEPKTLSIPPLDNDLDFNLVNPE